jgi:hypothetical protein
MKHINILKNEIDRAELRSIIRSIFFFHDPYPIRSKSRSNRIGQSSLYYWFIRIFARNHQSELFYKLLGPTNNENHKKIKSKRFNMRFRFMVPRALSIFTPITRKEAKQVTSIAIKAIKRTYMQS